MYMYKKFVIEDAKGERRTVTVKKGNRIPIKPGEKVVGCCGGFNKAQRTEGNENV